MKTRGTARRVLAVACLAAAATVAMAPATTGAKPKPKIAFNVVTSQGLTGLITYHRNHPTVGARAILASIPVSVTCVEQNNFAVPPTVTTTTEQVAFGIAGTIAKNASSASIAVSESNPVNPLEYSKRALQLTLTPKKKKKGPNPPWKRAAGSLTYEQGTGAKGTPSSAQTKVCRTPAPVTFGPA